MIRLETKISLERVIKNAEKKGGIKVIKTFTDVRSKQPNGTLHSYNYFEDETGEWIYNIIFHIDGCFAPVQLKFPKRISITKVVQKARKIFEKNNMVSTTRLKHLTIRKVCLTFLIFL